MKQKKTMGEVKQWKESSSMKRSFKWNQLDTIVWNGNSLVHIRQQMRNIWRRHYHRSIHSLITAIDWRLTGWSNEDKCIHLSKCSGCYVITRAYTKTCHLTPIRKYKLFVRTTATSGMVIVKCVCLILRELKKKDTLKPQATKPSDTWDQILFIPLAIWDKPK